MPYLFLYDFHHLFVLYFLFFLFFLDGFKNTYVQGLDLGQIQVRIDSFTRFGVFFNKLQAKFALFSALLDNFDEVVCSNVNERAPCYFCVD
jgi:hypothetical protein